MHFYDFVSYCGMLTDEERLAAYYGALKACIGPESVVLDLGAGTGIFSVIACDLGARKVYALEVNPLIKLVQETVHERGFSERLQIIQKHSKDVELEEKANILVTDIHGGFPLFESGLETIIDARERLLTPDAVIIPAEETVFFAVSESPEIYEKGVEQYLQEFHGFKIPASERLVRNRWFAMRSEDERLLTAPAVFAKIDHRTNEDTTFAAEMEWIAEENGTAHGLRGWFENTLYGEFGVSNGLGHDRSTYSAPFFPFESPVALSKGDRIVSKVVANYEDGNYAWSWTTEIFDEGSTNKKADFKQTVMASLIIDTKGAMKRTEYFQPRLGNEGAIDSYILMKMDGELMNGDIADMLLQDFPDRFRDFDHASERVFALAERYAES